MSTAQLLADPDWYLDGLDLQTARAQFVKAPRSALEGAAFLDERLDRSGMERRDVPLSDLAQTPTPTPSQAPGFIWHSAFCGSTLLARLVSVPGKTLALREPASLAVLASLKRHGRRREYEALLRPVLAALACQAGDARVVIKPTNVVTTLAADAARLFPASRHVFLTSDAPAFLISIAKKKESGRALARRMYAMVAKDAGFDAALPADQLATLTDLQVAALLWRLQIQIMARTQADLAPGAGAWLDGDRFLAAPEPGLRAVAAFLQLELEETDIANALDAGRLGRDAKDPSRTYGAQDRAREADEQARLIGPDLDRIVEWCFKAVPGSPRQGYLTNALV